MGNHREKSKGYLYVRILSTSGILFVMFLFVLNSLFKFTIPTCLYRMCLNYHYWRDFGSLGMTCGEAVLHDITLWYQTALDLYNLEKITFVNRFSSERADHINLCSLTGSFSIL